MFVRFAAAASTFTLAAVHAQGQILDTDFPDFIKKIHKAYDVNYDQLDEDDLIGMCVYGDSDPPTIESFDGQFEGLAPRPEDRYLRVI